MFAFEFRANFESSVVGEKWEFFSGKFVSSVTTAVINAYRYLMSGVRKISCQKWKSVAIDECQ